MDVYVPMFCYKFYETNSRAQFHGKMLWWQLPWQQLEFCFLIGYNIGSCPPSRVAIILATFYEVGPRCLTSTTGAPRPRSWGWQTQELIREHGVGVDDDAGVVGVDAAVEQRDKVISSRQVGVVVVRIFTILVVSAE